MSFEQVPQILHNSYMYQYIHSSYYGSSHSRVCCCTTIGYWVGQPAKRWQMLFVFDLLLLVGNAVQCTQSLRWLLIWSYEPRTGRSTTSVVLTTRLQMYCLPFWPRGFLWHLWPQKGSNWFYSKLNQIRIFIVWFGFKVSSRN